MGKSKYLVIYEWLSEQIRNKVYQPGDKIPNESDLAAMFGVHRMTVRQAIDKLVNDHMLVRKRSKGTFLLSEKSPVLTRSLESITTYYDDIVSAGLAPHYKTIAAGIEYADAEVAAHLNLAERQPVIFLYRLMLASGVPLVLERSILPTDMVPDFLEKKLDTVLYKVLHEDYGMRLLYSRQELGAVMPTESERKHLKIGDNCPCIWVESVVYTDTGRAVEYSRALHRGDKYRFRCAIGGYVYDKDGTAGQTPLAGFFVDPSGGGEAGGIGAAGPNGGQGPASRSGQVKG
ncbi:GntR family transcriptional regulator [Nitratidesulfovibrio sp. SRB-5]|uniref:GntR family transcriptional regulator n=1 Tax=Nitratidesulfovibrio sp. SRB-5 TaxID=2872636 RepID=UPI001024E0DC|nr:GntR family transcriptional regulator [Nitratidesulfovibrio sp. SRB-5]MBZ2171900.1 GntR family transcriptional regulator [Nitratidesulfovibrio sp. SRB-5]RXF75242.1 GntR family transcriptional regulator [Desulfovibrio sp. DS-1]